MKKNLLFAFAILFVGSSTWACKIVVTNDTNNTITGRDLNNLKSDNRFSIEPGDQKQIGMNPDIHGRFTIKIGSGNWHVRQIACSKNHLVPIKATDIVNKKLDPGVLASKRFYIIDTVKFIPPRKIG